MNKSRMTVLAAVAAFALLLVGGAGPAAAQTPPQLTQVVKLTGTAKNGKTYNGTFTIQRFAQRDGKLAAIGTMRFRKSGRTFTRRNVAVPAALARQAQASQILPTTGACQILNLTLQPIDLNLLGLRVRTSRIDVRIEGVPGSGNLLGNLLCSITGILDPGALSNNQIIALLNAILALIPRQ